jgi:hypothetical protein
LAQPKVAELRPMPQSNLVNNTAAILPMQRRA